VSRQREWQKKMIAKGRCRQCGSERTKYKELCDECNLKERERKRNAYRRKRGGRVRQYPINENL